MKKSILFLAVTSVFALASCGEKTPEVVETPVDSAAVVATVDSASAIVDSAAAVVDSAAATATEAAH